jgi:site-specific recombinase XerD
MFKDNKMAKIKNKAYRDFLDNGIIQTISESDLKAMLDQVSMKEKKKPTIARALIIFLYLTGATPLEALYMKARDIYKEGTYFCIKMRGIGSGKKKRMPRIIRVSRKNKIMQELYNYAIKNFPEMSMFYIFQTTYTRRHVTKSKNPLKNGIETFRTEKSDGLRYYFQKWFGDKITPYFFRHNRFSKLSEEGVSMEQLRMFKGCKTYESIVPYTHLSSDISKKIAKKIK